MNLTLTVAHLPAVNFSMQQNHVPIFRTIEIKNEDDQPAENLTVRLTFDPGFATPWSMHIDRIDAGDTYTVKDINLILSTDYFIGLSESLIGSYNCNITQGDNSVNEVSGNIGSCSTNECTGDNNRLHHNAYLCEEAGEIKLLAYDQWSGIAVMPELIAAFVTPNNIFVSSIIRRASEILGSWTSNPSLDEYQQRDPDRIKLMMASLFAAIKEQNITYSSMMANYEELGQRIRLCDAIAVDRLANCLEMTILYASCMEAIGLHPLIVFTKGHSFVGGWLIPDTFPDSVNDDVSLITKRTADGINEIIVVEATMMCSGNNATFDQAAEQANYNLAKCDEFHLFCDIRRARAAGIRSLPTRIASNDGWTIKTEIVVDNQDHHAPTTLSATDIIIEQDVSDIGKQNLWERKLLDLSLRNTLLNTRISKGTIQILSTHVNQIEDALSDGTEYTILPKPSDWNNPLINHGIYQSLNVNDPMASLLDQEREQHKLRSYLNETDLKISLTRLYRSSRLSMEENGANTLYLALGMLRWYETTNSKRARYAPILLLPVEIIRRSVATGYVIRSRDEDITLNITLVEMLRQLFNINVSITDPLPKDESGIDVPLIFNTFRHAVMNMHGWDVEDMAMLGNFSFSKFVMWNDIHSHAEELARNNIVRSLIDGRLSEKVDVEEDDEEKESLEDIFEKDNIVLPISADSSQMAAILAALRGKSFILHGPPGTGKSQTITNIIANALYKGKRVLFVAEKMAALEVVQRRLESIGLAPFCLELHSNRAKKSAVLEQLRRTTEVTRRQRPEAYAIKAQQMAELREELSSYEQSIHKKRESGLSIYDCMSLYAGYEDFIKCKTIDSDFVDSITPAIFENCLLLVKEYQSVASIVGDFVDNPLIGVGLTNYSQDIQQLVENDIDAILEKINQIESDSAIIRRIFDIEVLFLERKERDVIGKILTLLYESQNFNKYVVLINADENLKQAKQYFEIKKDISLKKAELSESYNDSIFSIDSHVLLSQWRIASSKWFLKRLKLQKAIVTQLQSHTKSGTKPDKKNVEQLLISICELQERETLAETKKRILDTSIQRWIDAGITNWDNALMACDETITLNKALFELTQSIESINSIKTQLSDLLLDGMGLFHQLYDGQLKNCSATMSKIQEREDSIISKLQLNDNLKKKLSTLSAIKETTTAIKCKLNGLRDWCVYNVVREKMTRVGLGSFCQYVEDGEIDVPHISDSYQKSIYRSCADRYLSMEPRLNLFHEVAFEEKISQFKQLCSLVEKITQEEVASHLSASLPAFHKEASQASEVGILQRNIRNGGRGVPLRRLFDQIDGILPRMCPCMLMSPMSVAQYIDPSKDLFDLVVFDEASQMPTCEAVGAIARGSQLIVVGDPNQMPPTSFFASNTFNEDLAEQEDLESILDDCLALCLPSIYLKWHYRSKSESLITFSNVNYYDNKLMTFPSPNDLKSKVTYQHVDGIYERGGSRQNKAEAEAVVAEVKRRLNDTILRKRSIGIVTFNTNQQSIIEDLLTEMLESNPELEKIANEMDEHIFVKNLENVQGDERDIILFSVGFGPDREGRIALNFGPLNRDGGWRRLNVAVSRARYEMKVFSTLRASDIDLNRTSASGVAGLRSFLDYADKGPTLLQTIKNSQSTSTNENSNKGNTSDGVVKKVDELLRKQGFEVCTNIGCSGYKIDLGIVNPNDKSHYIVGIIFDGYNYDAAKTTRDREIVQPTVLRVLGWNICRVWALAWWLSPEKVVNKIVKCIRDAIESNQSDNSTVELDSYSDKPLQSESIEPTKPIVIPENPYSKPYIAADLEPITISPDEIANGNADKEVFRRLCHVIDMEAPISRSLLFRKVTSSLGIARTGTRLGPILIEIAKKTGAIQTIVDDDVFYWRQDQKPEKYWQYRPHSDRDALDIAPEEIAVAAFYIKKEQGSLPEESLYREIAHEFNFTRLGNNVMTAIKRGLDRINSMEEVNN